MQLLAAENLLHGEAVPLLRNGGRDLNAFRRRTQAQDAFHAADHHGAGGTGQPVHMAPAGEGAFMAFDELSVDIRLDHPAIRILVEGGGAGFLEILERTVAVARQRLRQDCPALGLAEDAAVFLRSGVEQAHPGAFEIVIAIAGLHEFEAVRRVQLLAGRVQDDLRLLRRGGTADDRPGLGIEPHGGFPVLLAADDVPGIAEAADEPVAFEAFFVQNLQEVFRRLVQIFHIIRLILAEFLHDVQRVIQLEGYEGAFSLGAEHQAVIPVRMQAGGHPVRAQMGHAEVDRALEVLPDRSRILVRERNLFIQISDIARLGNILVYRREQPEGIVRPVARMAGLLHIAVLLRGVLMAGIMRILDQGQTRAVMHLGAEHEGQLLPGQFRIQMHDALDILNGIPVSVPVPLAAVDQARRAAPDKGGEALERIPRVDHRVKGRIRRMNLQVFQLAVPVADQLGKLLLHRLFQILIPIHNLPGLEDRLLTQKEGSRRLSAGFQSSAELQRAAGIAVIVQAVVALSVQHGLGSVEPVPAQELFPPARIGRHLRAGQAEEAFPPGRPIRIRIVELVDLLQDEIFVELRPRDELGVLHVHQVLGIEALRCELRIAEDGDLPRPVRQVLQGDAPDLMGRTHGDIVQGAAADPVVLADEFRIARAVVAFSLVLIQRLLHRFPAGGPEFPGLLIAQIDIPAGLIKLIEYIAEDPPGCAALDEAVSAGIHRDDGAVIRRAKIVGPRGGSIRIGNHIFSGFFVKVSVFHPFFPP